MQVSEASSARLATITEQHTTKHRGYCVGILSPGTKQQGEQGTV